MEREKEIDLEFGLDDLEFGLDELEFGLDDLEFGLEIEIQKVGMERLGRRKMEREMVLSLL